MHLFFRKLREVYDSYGGEMKLYNVLEAYEKLTNRSLEINRLYNYLSTRNGNITNTSISFERFCALMAEFSNTEGCDMCTTDGRVYYSSLYWTCALLKTRFLVRSCILRPIASALGIDRTNCNR